jgi:hypothetical protein
MFALVSLKFVVKSLSLFSLTYRLLQEASLFRLARCQQKETMSLSSLNYVFMSSIMYCVDDPQHFKFEVPKVCGGKVRS